MEGIAYIVMGEAFVELAQVNDGYSQGRTLDLIKPSGVGLGVLAELERFTVGQGSGFQLGPSAPSQAVLKRLIHEKRGFHPQWRVRRGKGRLRPCLRRRGGQPDEDKLKSDSGGVWRTTLRQALRSSGNASPNRLSSSAKKRLRPQVPTLPKPLKSTPT